MCVLDFIPMLTGTCCPCTLKEQPSHLVLSPDGVGLGGPGSSDR